MTVTHADNFINRSEFYKFFPFGEKQIEFLQENSFILPILISG